MDRVRDHYDAQPWPAPGAIQAPALPDHWLDAAAGRRVLVDGARILIAGCGTGGEAAAFAARCPGASVVGLDFSPASIAHAQAAGFEGDITFDVADLTDDISRYGTFDLVCCHAVADYVPDRAALFARLAGVVAPDGVLYVGTNSARHPRQAIQAAFAGMGLPSDRWVEAPATRAGLRIVQALTGDAAPIAELASRPTALLASDVFAPFAHGVDLESWATTAAAAGLHLAASLAALWALPAIGDGDLPLLYGTDRAGLARLVASLRHPSVLQLLFVRARPPTPPWRSPALWDWTPTVHPHLGRGHFPPLTGDWMASRFVGLATPGLPELRLAVSAWMLELYHRCDGASVAEVRATMPVPAHDEHLRASLYRFWQAGFVHLEAPGGA